MKYKFLRVESEFKCIYSLTLVLKEDTKFPVTRSDLKISIRFSEEIRLWILPITLTWVKIPDDSHIIRFYVIKYVDVVLLNIRMSNFLIDWSWRSLDLVTAVTGLHSTLFSCVSVK